MPSEAVFVDTSIQIGRRVHGPLIQKSIRARLAQYPEVVTGLIVRREFKHRLLKEARYLLSQFAKRGSYAAVLRHVIALPSTGFHVRPKQICLQTLATIDESDTDQDRTDRARFYLRAMLRLGLKEFDSQLSDLKGASGCAYGLSAIKELKPFKDYDFGPDKCEKFGHGCGIVAFLTNNLNTLYAIADYLAKLPPGSDPGQKSAELERAEEFIHAFIANPAEIQKRNPCAFVGDLLIALESIGVPDFYTMNARESQHLCRVLGQSMIFRHPNSDHPEQKCATADPNWPQF